MDWLDKSTYSDYFVKRYIYIYICTVPRVCVEKHNSIMFIGRGKTWGWFLFFDQGSFYCLRLIEEGDTRWYHINVILCAVRSILWGILNDMFPLRLR